MDENEEKNTSSIKDTTQNHKQNKDNLHYKKIKIKPFKKDEDEEYDVTDININHPLNLNFDIPNKIKINSIQNKINDDEKEYEDKNEDDKNFRFEDLNSQLDEILENIENDGIEEINKKIKLLNEDKNMFNTISYSDNKNIKDSNFKKINKNTNKIYHKIKIGNDKSNKYNNHINNYKHFNQNNKHYMLDNRNITNNRFLFTSLNNTQRNWKEENNCNNDDCDNYMNKTNISLFYKYNKLYNSKKKDEE